MELYVLNRNREMIGVVDHYESLIWTPRYYEVGDFEIYIKASPEIIELFAIDNYIVRSTSTMVGIIERVELTTNIESGDYIIVTGRCLKSLLERRIVWKQRYISGTAENVMRTLISENAISPTLSYRAIPNLVLGASNGWSDTISAQYTGDNLLDVVIEICKTFEYGFRVVLNNSKNFEIQFYKGVNRSYEQHINPYVVFSPDFENIISSDYIQDKSTLKNACNVAGEGEGTERKYYGVGTTSGLDRREIFVDARDISSDVETEVETEDGTIETVTTTMPIEEYNNLLIERGRESLAENQETISFEGEVESIRQYVYGEDYFLGDIVQVKNKYGVESASRIIEVIENHDKEGYSIIPTFEKWEVYDI